MHYSHISSYEKLSKTGTNLAVTRALRNAKNVATLDTMCILTRNTEYVLVMSPSRAEGFSAWLGS